MDGTRLLTVPRGTYLQGEPSARAVPSGRRPGPVRPGHARVAGSPTAVPRLAWVPDAMTLLRFALVPVFVALADRTVVAMESGEQAGGWRLVTLGAWFAIGLSDVVDGTLARRLGGPTPLGAFLDALADKLAQLAALIYFATHASAAFGTVPRWYLALVVGRDLVLGAGWLVLRRRRGLVSLEHRFHGKLSSALMFVLIAALIAGSDGPVVTATFLLSGLVILSSTVDYLRAGGRALLSTPKAQGANRCSTAPSGGPESRSR